MNVNEFLEAIQDTYQNEKYINVVGLNTDFIIFLDICREKDIWTYRLCPFTVFLGYHLKVIFLKKSDEDKVRKIVDRFDGLVMNASNPF